MLAGSLAASGHVDEALTVARHALSACEASFSPDSEEVAYACHNLAQILLDLQKVVEPLPEEKREDIISEFLAASRTGNAN